MAKQKTVFMCQECGNEFPRWQGRCPACSAWNSLVEAAPRPAPARGASRDSRPAARPTPIADIPAQDGARIGSGIGEFDRIMGGGLIEGCVALVGGEPGVGKSTLMLQVAQTLAQGDVSRRVLYVTGEESALQTRMRAERLGALSPQLFLLCETNVEQVLDSVHQVQPAALVIDSIQTLQCDEIGSAPGSVAQIRESAGRLVRMAKESGVVVFLVGHVTKEGVVAGPRLLEHMVDTVLYFEGDSHFSYRILRAVKNRFGSTNEIGIFEMTERGLGAVENPSQMLLSQRPGETAGSVVLAAMEGSRPLLVEVQALVSPCGSFGSPRRSAHGMDARRLALVLAVLEKRVGIPLSNQDVFVNIAGGIRIEEPALDLAVAAAVAGSAVDRPVSAGTVVFGEVGLAGETRSVGQMQSRFDEARRLGFDCCVYGAPRKDKVRGEKGLALHPASTVQEALRLLALHGG